MRIKKILCKTVAVITTAAMLTGYGSVLDTEASEYESDSEEIVVIEETDSEETPEIVTTEETSSEEETKSASLMATSEYDFAYSFLDDGTILVSNYCGYDTEIEIPSTIDGYTVTAIGDYAIRKSSMTSITIPESVTSIGDEAFSGCNN